MTSLQRRQTAFNVLLLIALVVSIAVCLVAAFKHGTAWEASPTGNNVERNDPIQRSEP